MSNEPLYDILPHFVKYQKRYILLLAFIVLFIPLLINSIQGDPLLMGQESYFVLEESSRVPWYHFSFSFINILQSFLPASLLFCIPFLLGIGTLLLYFRFGDNKLFSRQWNFIFLLILVSSPAFIFTFSTISATALFAFFTLTGFVLLTEKKVWLHYCGVVPFAIAATLDIFHSFFLLVIVTWFLHTYKWKKHHRNIAIATAASTLLLGIITKLPFLLGPFSIPQLSADFISDLGGMSGMSFFVIMIALVGLFTAWKRKSFIVTYFFLLFTIATYIYAPQTIFVLTLVTIVFAAFGLQKLVERKWILEGIRTFTLLLLLLGLLFSLSTYEQRLHTFSPMADQVDALTWLHDTTPGDVRVFSNAENEHFIRYFAERDAFSSYNKNQQKTDAIFNATSVSLLFRLLEEDNIKYIYLTPQLKQELERNQQFIYLLENERFKLEYHANDVEVWQFRKR
ncbi:TPA: hypothetical protein HA278_06955 [Candidatus Woesearchaeota archaeon]|nr:hypothetical protein [Candidatus Woesearchaeota archaeon]